MAEVQPSTKWPHRRLKFLVSSLKEKASPASGERPYIGLEQIESWTGRYAIDPELAVEGEGLIFDPGDVLFGTLRPYLAKVALPAVSGIATTEALVLRPTGEIDARYLQYSLLRPTFIHHVNAATYGTKMPRTNWETVGSSLQPLPPMSEQIKIVRHLNDQTSEIDDLIAKKRRLLELLAEKRAAIITRAVTKGLNPDAPMKPSGIDWLGDIPAHWDVASLKWRCQIPSGQVDPTKEDFAKLPLIAPDFIESETGVLTEPPTAQEQGAISGKYHFPAGTVVYSKIRPLLAKVCISPFDALCSADMYPINPSPNLKNEFLFFQLLSGHFTSFAVMESLRVAMPKVNRETLGTFPLLVPPLEEQDTITRDISIDLMKIDGTRALITHAIERLVEYRTAIITKAVSGELDPIGTSIMEERVEA
jgi:type I restriction enzyme S subunit